MTTDHYPSRRASQPAFVPRKDPVVYGGWHPDAPLSREQTERFARDGYIVLHGLFSAGEIALLQDEATRMLTHPDGLMPDTIIRERGGEEVRSIFEIHTQNALMRRLAADDRMAGIASYLLDDQVYIHQSRLNYKPGYKGKDFFWHSDFETWHVEDGLPRMRTLSMSVLLARNTAANGPLMLMPGSHLEYLSCVGETPQDHYLQSLRKQEYGVPDEDSLARMADRHGIDIATGEAGSVIIFDCNTMHGSNGNITPYPRSNAFFVFNAVSNRPVDPFGPDKPRPPFVAAREPEAIAPVAGPINRPA